ncbi:MAG TPA: long-chain fatty acid--CoA ligase [Blastocatellia bacterium]|nr:long-chain fatty acid--CoA ligase [Blastocatellia bacterium]
MTAGKYANLRELLEQQVERYRDKPFLFVESDERVFTYGEFDREVNRLAALLAALGVRKGDRVSLYLTNSAEYFIAYFACFKLGAWAGPVNALLKPQEIEFIVSNSEASVVLTQPDLYDNLAAVRDRLPLVRHVAVASGQWSVVSEESSGQWPVASGQKEAAGDASARAIENEKEPPPDSQQLATDPWSLTADDEAVIIYTSGTTGKPKGVLLTHGNLLTNAREIAAWLQLTEDDRSLMIMPLFHVNALMTTGLAALWAGGSVVLAPRFSASRHWQTISQYGVTYFGSVATMLSRLNHSYPEGVPAELDTSRLRFALCGSAPVPVEVLKTYEARFACPVIEGYGLSESTCRATFNPIDGNRRPGSVGLPIGNEMNVFDDGDNELPPFQVGEIVLRGANLLKGYYQNEAATRQAFRSGWFHTGDLGYRDDEGFYYVVDRKSDMIIRGGENIYPREIDEVLYQHPKVKDAATVGVADELYGEEVKSFVVLRDGCQASEEEIIAHCRAHLADYKCPKSVAFLDDIPKGPTGKLLKRELAKQ